jgi:hypothetical protein
MEDSPSESLSLSLGCHEGFLAHVSQECVPFISGHVDVQSHLGTPLVSPLGMRDGMWGMACDYKRGTSPRRQHSRTHQPAAPLTKSCPSVRYNSLPGSSDWVTGMVRTNWTIWSTIFSQEGHNRAAFMSSFLWSWEGQRENKMGASVDWYGNKMAQPWP